MTLRIFGRKLSNGKSYELTEIVSNVQWFTSIESQAGKLTFSMVDDDEVFYHSGDIVDAFFDNNKFFSGRIFIRQKQEDRLWRMTAYDKLRYLQNEDMLIFKVTSAAERFGRICKLQGLKHSIGNVTGHKCKSYIADGKTYFTILDDAIRETKHATGKQLIIYDNAGTLRLTTVTELKTNLLLGDKSLITNFDYQSSIDDAINSVKVVREDEKKKTRQVYIAQNKANIAQWGKLQKVENAKDSKMNARQLQKQADDLLKQSNRETSTLSLESVGDMKVRAGSSFNLSLSDLRREWGKTTKVALVKSCTHTFTPAHTMSMEVGV